MHFVDRQPIVRRCKRGCTEIGRGVAGQSLDHGELRCVERGIELQARGSNRARVARGVLNQSLERRILVPPAPAPPGPVDRPGKCLLLAGLKIDADFLRRSCHGFLSMIRGYFERLVKYTRAAKPPIRIARRARQIKAIMMSSTTPSFMRFL